MFKVRLVKTSDLKALIDLRLSLLKHYPEAFLATYQEESKKTSEEWGKDFFVDNQILMVEEKGRLIGMVYYSRFKYERAAHILRISGLGVLPEFRRQGVGGLLMRAVINWAKEQKNIHRIQVESFVDNFSAIAFYQKMGFKKESVIKMMAQKEDGSFKDSAEMVMFI